MISRIGKYTVEAELGRGGFGQVYRAWDPDVRQSVAIKVLLAQGDPDLLKRFRLEVVTTASLHHKNIVTIYASGEEDGTPYLVMELLEGQTLSQIIKEKIPLPLLDKVRIMTQVAEGLAYAHSKGVVHRDVKPANIMLLPDGSVKIMDFGIALASGRRTVSMTLDGFVVGTVPYMSPEQFTSDAKANEQTDIFSFGDVYYELLTGRHPFEPFLRDLSALRVAILTHDPPPVSQVVPECPEGLELLVHRSIAKEREFRYQKFEELRLDSATVLVDLQHDLASSILREVPRLVAIGNLEEARTKVREAQRLEPGNRQARALLETIDQKLQEKRNRERVAVRLVEAEKHLSERRFAEAVQVLEHAAKLDTTNFVVQMRLVDAKAKLDGVVQANRLVEEARVKQSRGELTEALDRLSRALQADSEHAEAIRLHEKVSTQLARRERDQVRQRALAAAAAHLAEKRFNEASAVLDELEREEPGGEGIAELRREIEHEKAEEDRRIRAERFNLALTRTRETMQSGELERAAQMLSHLDANFAGEPGAAEVLPILHERLDALVRARDIAVYRQQATDLLNQKSFAEASAVLAQGLEQYPDDPGLLRQKSLAEALLGTQIRTEAVAGVIERAKSLRDAGDFSAALAAIEEGRRRLGDEAAFDDLARELEMRAEQQRYAEGLENLLGSVRALMAAGKHGEAIEEITRAREYTGEAEVLGLLVSARTAAAAEEERQFVASALAGASSLPTAAERSRALRALETAQRRYPHNSGLSEAIQRLREEIERDERHAAIERSRAGIAGQIEAGEWKAAQAAAAQARTHFPEENVFSELAVRIEEGLRNQAAEDALSRIRNKLIANNLPEAMRDLEETRAVFAGDRRWADLHSEIQHRQEYEAAIEEAERQRREGKLTEAEALLTGIIQNAPDLRATQMFSAIQGQRVEIGALVERVRQSLERNDLRQAAAELKTARAKFPDEAAWEKLQAEIAARETVLREQSEAANEIRAALVRDDTRKASQQLTEARRRFGNDALWAGLQGEIEAREAALRRQAEIAELSGRVREFLKRDDLVQAAECLRTARRKYPDETGWSSLQQQVDSRQTVLDRQAQAAAAADRVRGYLGRDDVAQAARELSSARDRFPGEGPWEALAKEVDERRALMERRQQIAQAAEKVRELIRREDLQAASAELGAASRRFPGEPVWSTLTSEIDAARRLLERREKVAAAAASVREHLNRREIPAARSELERARAAFAGEEIWTRLQSEIDALVAEIEAAQAEERRQREIREVGSRAEALLAQGKAEEAAVLIEARHAAEPVLRDLLTRARRELERRRCGHQLLAIEQQIDPGLGKRRLRKLDADAQRTAAPFSSDEEVAAIASRIHARVEALIAEPPAKKPIPWKLAGAVAAAIAAVGLAAMVIPRLLHKPEIAFEVRTDPPGASVRIGDHTCQTPNCQLQLAPGSYQITAELKDYTTKQETVVVDGSRHLAELTLEPVPVAPPPPPPPGHPPVSTGTLVVETGVPGALIYVDGTPRSRTDQSGSQTLSLEAAAYEIRVERNGYERVAPRKVTIAGGSHERVIFTLTLERAKLELGGAPAGVEIRDSGTLLGRTDGSAPFAFPTPITPGDRSLEVKLGSNSRAIQRHFDPGQTVHLDWKDIAPATPPPPLTAEELERQAWERVRSSQDITQVRTFLRSYPNGAHRNEAQSQIDDLTWASVNHSDIEAVRRFLQQNPGSRHQQDAQTIVDQFDQRAREQKAEQERIRQEQAKKTDDQQRRLQILGVIRRLDTALQKRNERDAREVWPGISKLFLESMNTAGTQLSLNTSEPNIHLGDQASFATVECELVSKVRTRATTHKGILILRRNGTEWTIQDAKFN